MKRVWAAALFAAASMAYAAAAEPPRDALTRLFNVAVTNAATQFQALTRPTKSLYGYGLDPSLGKPLFDECDAIPRGAKLIMECAPSDKNAFTSRRRFVAAARAALPRGFSAVDCPSAAPGGTYKEHDYLTCFENAAGVQINLITDHTDELLERYGVDIVPGGNATDWRVVALRKVLTFGQRAAENLPASYTAPGWLRGTPNAVPNGTIVDICQYWPVDGRLGINCYTTQTGAFGDKSDVTAVVKRAMPAFAPIACPPPSSPSWGGPPFFCAQNAEGSRVEIMTYGANYAILLAGKNAPPFHRGERTKSGV